MPLIEVARTKTKPEALEALERVEGAASRTSCRALHPADMLVDGMRGSSSLWYRVRVNLQHVPEAERPPQEELIADYDPWAGKAWPGQARRLSGRALLGHRVRAARCRTQARLCADLRHRAHPDRAARVTLQR